MKSETTPGTRSPQGRRRSTPGTPPPPFEGEYFVKQFIPYLLNQVTNKMNLRFKQELKPFDLSISQWRVLAAVMSDADLSLKEIASRTAIDQPTLSRIVDQLVARGLLTREARETDGRFNAITLTRSGNAHLERAWPAAWDEACRAAASLTPAENEDLTRLLIKMLAGLT